MPRLPSSIEAAETENMDFNTHSAQDFDGSFNLSESGSLYSPTLSELEQSLGDFQTDRDECMTVSLPLYSQTRSENATEIDEPGPSSPVMPSRRACTKQSQQKQKQRKKASDIRSKKRAAVPAVLSNMKPEKRPRNLRSPVWKAFNYKRKEDGSEDKSIVVCDQCDAEITKPSGTTSMKNHLR